MWVGRLCDEKLLSRAAAFCEKEKWTDAAATLSSLSGVDAFPPYSYSLERAASRLGRSSVPVEVVMERLRSSGFKCVRQPFEDLSLKTDADREELEEAVKGVSGALA
jgi:tRNA G26 N,N-dimethylase Trm1